MNQTTWKAKFTDGRNFFAKRKYGDALLMFDQAILLADNDSNRSLVHDARAAVHEKQGNFKAAVLDGKQAIKLGPGRWQGYRRVAHAAINLEKFNEALKFVEVAIERAGDDPSRLEELDNLRRMISKNINHIGKLPVELLAEILSFVVSEDPSRSIALSCVCSHWRRVAHNTACLWDTLVLTQRSPVLKTKTWIRRTKGRIRVLCLRKSLLNNLDWKFSMLNGLNWQILRGLQLADVEIIQGLESIAGVSALARLHGFEICDSTRHNDQRLARDREALFSSFTAYRLQTLVLDGIEAVPPFLHQELSELRMLALRNVRQHYVFESFLEILSRNPNIEEITCDIRVTTPAILPDPPPPINLEHLQHIALSGFYFAGDLFKRIKFSSLRTVTVSNSASSLDGLLQALDGVTTLQELALSKSPLSAPPVIRVLAQNPELQSLTLLHLPNVANAVLEKLGVRNADGNATCCPGLLMLNISNCHDVSTEALRRVVDLRNPGDKDSDDTARLQTVVVDGCPRIKAESLPWFVGKVSRFSCIYMTKKEASFRR